VNNQYVKHEAYICYSLESSRTLYIGLFYTSVNPTVYIVSLKTAVSIFQIVNNTGVVTQLFLVKLETSIESPQRMSLNEN